MILHETLIKQGTVTDCTLFNESPIGPEAGFTRCNGEDAGDFESLKIFDFPA